MTHDERLSREGEVLGSLLNNPRIMSASLEPQLYRVAGAVRRKIVGTNEIVTQPFEHIGTLEAIEEYVYIRLGERWTR